MASNSEIKTKILKLRTLLQVDDDIPEVRKREKQARDLILKTSLMKNDAAIMMADECAHKIEGINSILINTEDISDLDRRLLQREREVHQFYLKRFRPEEELEALENLNKYLDFQIERLS